MLFTAREGDDVEGRCLMFAVVATSAPLFGAALEVDISHGNVSFPSQGARPLCPGLFFVSQSALRIEELEASKERGTPVRCRFLNMISFTFLYVQSLTVAAVFLSNGAG